MNVDLSKRQVDDSIGHLQAYAMSLSERATQLLEPEPNHGERYSIPPPVGSTQWKLGQKLDALSERLTQALDDFDEAHEEAATLLTKMR